MMTSRIAGLAGLALSFATLGARVDVGRAIGTARIAGGILIGLRRR